MALELHFVRSDKAPWGFRLTGGSDFGQVLSVVKVSPGSPAESAGLQVGDIIVRVNNTPTTGLTHTEAHDLISAAGNEYLLAVRRDDFEQLIAREVGNNINHEQINSEITNILNELNEEITGKAQNGIDASKSGFIEVEITIKDQQDSVPSQGDIVPHNKQTQHQDPKEILGQTVNAINPKDKIASPQPHAVIETPVNKKWSTFMQKPKRPKPKPKKTESEEPKGEPYRVIIKRQKKKGEDAKAEDVSPPQVWLKTQSEPLEEDNGKESVEKIAAQQETQEVEVVQAEEQLENKEEAETEGKTEDDADKEIEENHEDETASEAGSAEEKEEVSEVSLSLEEQLAQVQKQLLALSQLPSSIQSTLDAVTQQLAAIVKAKTGKHQTELHGGEEEVTARESNTLSEDEVTEHMSENEMADEEINGEVTFAEKTISEASGLDGNIEELDGEIKNQSEGEEIQEYEPENEAESDDVINEEEREAKRIAEEKQSKKLKGLIEETEESFPLTPLERPIILPGGRKWTQPDDACTFRKPKMSDEKIATAIETYSEVISGRTKGINFLKYQPPPKNLDYLQRSEVYRLVHDMEPPVKGIARRASRILAEQDYYEQKEETKMEP